MSIGQKEAQQIVLTLANEDYFRLHEIVWRLNSVYPKSTLDQKYSAAEQAVRSLIDRRWISLYQCKNYFDNYEEIEASSTEEILSNPVS